MFRKLTEENEENAAVWYAAIQIWEMYLRCRRGRNGKYAAEFFRKYAQLVILPFGEYTPEMFHWQREQPVTPIWNCREDAKLQIWYPYGKIPFECGVATHSLRPMLIYYRQRILDAGLLMRKCRHCGKIFNITNKNHLPHTGCATTLISDSRGVKLFITRNLSSAKSPQFIRDITGRFSPPVFSGIYSRIFQMQSFRLQM